MERWIDGVERPLPTMLTVEPTPAIPTYLCVVKGDDGTGNKRGVHYCKSFEHAERWLARRGYK